MLRACYLLKDTINKIGRMGKSLSANSDLDVLKKRLRFEYRNALVFFNELTSSLDDYRVDDALNDFIGVVNTVFDEEDWSLIKMWLETLPKDILTDYIEDLSENDLGFYPKQHQFDYTSATILEDEDLRNIGRCFKTQTNRPINFLDARCADGYNSSEIKKYSLENINLYGMEKNPSLANRAKDKECFTKIAKGGLTGAKCSNDVFDVALLIPTLQYTADITPMQTLKPRKEVEEFKQVTKYVREDGILIMILPYYRLTSQMCTLIAKNYKDVSIGEVRKWNDLLMIVGKKVVGDNELDEQTYNLLRTASLQRPTATQEELILNEYVLPIDLLEVSMFRGSVLDQEDINDIINESNLYESFFNKQSNTADSFDNQQPLLPFNIGQIGLVLTSGCLDGEIEELNGQYHVIKGMVKKEAVTVDVETDKKGETETKTTYTNKVQINLITPDGTIKTLA
jgi:hypothetical protein